MARKAKHQIRITRETWDRLNDCKGPGDSFNDVLERVLDSADDCAVSEG
jgi:predicted CopG family antitoxin